MVNLSKEDKDRIVEAIREAEAAGDGHVHVHVKNKISGDVLDEAKKYFHRLKLHRHAKKNGVLIFVAPESRQFAIIGDEGIHRHVGDAFWNQTRDRMAEHFRKGELAAGIVAGVRSAGEKLKNHFPRPIR